MEENKTMTAEEYKKSVEGKLIMSKNGDGPEVFYTVQGEGPRTGVPVVFVRVSGCNLNCSWCDTQYTWNWNVFDQSREQVFVPVEEVVDLIRKQAGDCRAIVITGGEPTLQWKSLVSMIDLLRSDGEKWFVELETNGSIVPNDELFSRVDEFNCSPKLKHSSNMKEKRFNQEALTKHNEGNKTVFKFVVGSPTDIDEVVEIQQQINIPTEKIWIMPEGINSAAIADKLPWVVELCKKYGFKVCNRMHVQIWGAMRGK